MRVRPSLFAAGALAQYGKAGFLPEAPAKTEAPKRGSLLTAAGKPAFAGPYADLHLDEKAKSASRVLATLSRFVDWVMAGAERARQRELERYLGKSVDLYDLERRLREIERGNGPIFGSFV